MKTILSSRKRHYLKTVSILLIVVSLVAGMIINCDGGAEYDLTMAVAPPGSGTATDLTGTSPYASGTIVSIKAEANEGYLFAEWTAPAGTFANSNLAETTFTMPAQNVIVTANFVSQLISTWYDLDAVRDNMSGNYTLINDLDFTTAGYDELAGPTANGGKGWTPIGLCNSDAFTGSFDGQGYEIRDLFIDRPDDNCVGLFGFVGQTGVVRNVGVVDFDVTGHEGVGGLVAATIGGTVSSSYVNGNVTGTYGVGGLVGQNVGGTVDKCCSVGSVNGNDSGGLVGWNSGNISNAFSTANVTGQSTLGGLVGFTDYGGIVSNSYSTGTVTGYDHVGGLMGLNEGTVSDSYSTGSVTGSTIYIGGLVGETREAGTVSDSFWDTETSGQATSDGGTGKTTAEMQDITTFSAWDIIAVADPGTRNPSYTWNIVNDETYPFLSWEA